MRLIKFGIIVLIIIILSYLVISIPESAYDTYLIAGGHDEYTALVRTGNFSGENLTADNIFWELAGDLIRLIVPRDINLQEKNINNISNITVTNRINQNDYYIAPCDTNEFINGSSLCIWANAIR